MLFLSQIIGRPVRDPAGEPIGTVADLIVAIGDQYPPVTGLVVKTDQRKIFLPWRSVERLDASGARLRVQTIDIGKFQQRPDEILLKHDLLDKQIVDIEGRKVIRVNDVSLDEVDGALRIVAVDVGAAGLLRRLGGPWITLARNMKLPVPARYINWEDVDPLESTIAGVRLRVPHAKLAQLHPSDLADILEDLAPERAADILEEMSPDDAADLVADLDQDTRDKILSHMEADEAEEVQELLGYPEDSAGGIMTTEYIALEEALTAAEAIDRLRELEPDAETIYYVYVTDDDGRLVGVLSLRDLIVAAPDATIASVMMRAPVAVGLLADQDEVAEVVAHYNLLAVPVVDDEEHLVGIVTVDDAIDTVIPTAWKKRLPRVFSR
jgi:magnesium transporter